MWVSILVWVTSTDGQCLNWNIYEIDHFFRLLGLLIGVVPKIYVRGINQLVEL